MLMKISIRKITVATLALGALLLLYLMPISDDINYELSKQVSEYVYTNSVNVIYLLDSNNYIARTTIRGCDCDLIETAKNVVQGLIVEGENNNVIPNGFKAIIPSGTEILDVVLDDKILTINFSKEL